MQRCQTNAQFSHIANSIKHKEAGTILRNLVFPFVLAKAAFIPIYIIKKAYIELTIKIRISERKTKSTLSFLNKREVIGIYPNDTSIYLPNTSSNLSPSCIGLTCCNAFLQSLFYKSPYLCDGNAIPPRWQWCTSAKVSPSLRGGTIFFSCIMRIIPFTCFSLMSRN